MGSGQKQREVCTGVQSSLLAHPQPRPMLSCQPHWIQMAAGRWQKQGNIKFSKPGFSNMGTVNFQMFKLVLEKAEEPAPGLYLGQGLL